MRPVLLALVTLAAAAVAQAQLRLPLVLSDGAVLQRDHEIPVWGWAAPGAEVAVALGGSTRVTTADAAGRWRTAFPARPAGGPLALAVTSGAETATAVNLLVGDVWLLSGQSNMEWTVKDAANATAEIASATDAGIRHFKVPQSFADAPQNELAGGAWAIGSPETVGDFSAVGYVFAREIREAEGVPIGLLHTSWGGSRIEPWMSAAMLGWSDADVEAARQRERDHEAELRAALRDRIGELPTEDAGMDGDHALWAAPDLDDAGWSRVHVPAIWEAEGYADLDGVAWYRTTVTLSEAEAAEGVTLGLGRIDDDDVAWVNGVRVGGLDNSWNVARRYAVPASALHAGDNVLAVRVVDHGGGGGIAGADDLVYVETASGARRSLVGDWRFKVGVVQLSSAGTRNQVPRILWNQMVAPLTPQPIKGVLWYQGESNANTMEDAVAYRDLFPAMIEGWRAAWAQPDLPFYWVQLANFHAPPRDAADTGIWPFLRASQSATLALPHTAEAVILDVGDADDIHPRDKQTVGHRLALAARALVYGEADLVYSGPRYRSHTVEAGRVVVAFDHVGGGLATRAGAPLGGFTLEDADGTWHDAEARIEGEHVVVWSEGVPAPVAVRYAWADNPVAATLTNAEGLPAAPFQADLRNGHETRNSPR